MLSQLLYADALVFLIPFYYRRRKQHASFSHALRSCSHAGLDHGVGHPLLLLYDVKAPNGQKSKEFKGLSHYPSNTSLGSF